MEILGLTGLAGSGKSTVADFLTRHYNCVEISLAGPLKEFCRQVFDFSHDQLYGPSERRNAKDFRYRRMAKVEGGIAPDFLTPRYALQTLGTEWGRDCYPDVWIDLGIRKAKEIRKTGALPVISDVRFLNEARRIREEGGEIWRVDRSPVLRIDRMPDYSKHASEREADEIIPDRVVWNTGTRAELEDHLRNAVYLHGIPLKVQSEFGAFP